MITTIDRNGTKMVAVVLDDDCNVEGYRKVLFKVLEYALLNQEIFPTAQIGGMELCTYVKLLRSFTDEVRTDDNTDIETSEV